MLLEDIRTQAKKHGPDFFLPLTMINGTPRANMRDWLCPETRLIQVQNCSRKTLLSRPDMPFMDFSRGSDSRSWYCYSSYHIDGLLPCKSHKSQSSMSGFCQYVIGGRVRYMKGGSNKFPTAKNYMVQLGSEKIYWLIQTVESPLTWQISSIFAFNKLLLLISSKLYGIIWCADLLCWDYIAEIVYDESMNNDQTIII